jgi:hypothetical protein
MCLAAAGDGCRPHQAPIYLGDYRCFPEQLPGAAAGVLRMGEANGKPVENGRKRLIARPEAPDACGDDRMKRAAMLPEGMLARLEREAWRRCTSVSAIVRECVEAPPTVVALA